MHKCIWKVKNSDAAVVIIVINNSVLLFVIAVVYRGSLITSGSLTKLVLLDV